MNFIEFGNYEDIDTKYQKKITALCDLLTDKIVTDSAQKYTDISKPFYVCIPTIGYYTIPVDLEYADFIYDYVDDEETGTALCKMVYEKLQSLDIYLLSKICEHYGAHSDFYYDYKELKDLLFDKIIKENKKLKEQVKDLAGQLEDFKALFNDVGDLNDQKIEK